MRIRIFRTPKAKIARQSSSMATGFVFNRENQKLSPILNPKKDFPKYSEDAVRKFFKDKYVGSDFEIELSKTGILQKVSVSKCGVGICEVSSGNLSPADRFFISPLGIVYPTCFDCLNKTRLHRTDRKFSKKRNGNVFQ